MILRRNPPRENLKDNQGQLVVEAVLLMVVMIGIATLVTRWMKDSQFVEKLTVEPWAKLSGMIQCGVWQPCGLDNKKPGMHPNSSDRVLSLDPSKAGGG